MNGNASHDIFSANVDYGVVDIDALGNIISMASRETVVPAFPSTWGQIKSLYRR